MLSIEYPFGMEGLNNLTKALLEYSDVATVISMFCVKNISVKSAFIRVMQKGYAVPDISKSILAVISESV
jgi:hypothetical protein